MVLVIDFENLKVSYLKKENSKIFIQIDFLKEQKKDKKIFW